MTKHYAENQRKGSTMFRTSLILDAVLSLHHHLSQNLVGPSNSTSLSPLIMHLAPLILDTSPSVRAVVLDIFDDLSPQVVPKEALQAHLPMLLLYIQNAMTHIQRDIRSDSTKFLAWMLDINGREVVRLSWTKLLASYAGLLGWSTGSQETSRIRLSRGSSVVGDVNVTARHVETLFSLVSVGISDTTLDLRRSRVKTVDYSIQSMWLQHHLIHCYLLPTHSAPFAHLNLFTSCESDPLMASHDVSSRRAHFRGCLSSFLQYLHDLSAELMPSDLSRHPRQNVADDLCVSIIRILALIKEVYLDDENDDPVGRLWKTHWRRCIAKISSLVDARMRIEGSRKVVREWELANISISS